MKKIIHLAILTQALLLTACGNDGSDSAVPQIVAATQSPCGSIDERPWCDTSLTPDARTSLLLNRMTISQKIKLLSGGDIAAVATADPYTGVVFGIPELGIPDLRMADGPVGARGSTTTSMPTPISLGATFNPMIAYAVGQTIANEVKNKGNDLLHGPVADLARNPLAGRGFETTGEDPYLTSRLTVEWIRGAQSEGVMTNVKHFIANHQEGQVGLPPLMALVGGRHLVNAVIDERTLREIYLPPFEAAVKEADAASIMCAYNYLNGDPTCSSKPLLQDILRQEWGFKGFIVSDYILSVKDTNKTLTHGAEIEMPIGFFLSAPLVQTALLAGEVTETDLDNRVGATLRTLFKYGFFDRQRYIKNDNAINQAKHAQVARDAAEQGIVLLRNNNDVLPLKESSRTILVIGSYAIERPSGGGSSSTIPFQFQTPLDAIKARVGTSSNVIYDDGSDSAKAATLAATADVVLVFATDRASEGTDKLCLRLDCSLADLPDPILLNAFGSNASNALNLLLDPILQAPGIRDILGQISAPIVAGSSPIPGSSKNQDALIASVAKAQPNTVVILQTSAAVLTPWREQVAAILEAWYPGQEGGQAITRVLFGDTDPGGRLPVSFPDSEMDTPVAGKLDRYPGLLNQAYHTEGVFIGYRWFDAESINPAYPFGFGLSYSSFNLSNMAVHQRADGNYEITGQVTNIGSRDGWAVPQLYVSLPAPDAATKQPPVVLKGFSKHWLQSGQTAALNYIVTPKDLSYWSLSEKTWKMAPGCYIFSLGESSRNLKLRKGRTVTGSSCEAN
ncbi:beta-glucosidase [Paraperlucidibaca wandonensis]|uniref:Beta-glucosidase n=1 Tax=Paraperlucidibaca wandonensis TaxID=1268273 RepID=A0ABW3HEW2_9GAMM